MAFLNIKDTNRVMFLASLLLMAMVYSCAAQGNYKRVSAILIYKSINTYNSILHPFINRCYFLYIDSQIWRLWTRYTYKYCYLSCEELHWQIIVKYFFNPVFCVIWDIYFWCHLKSITKYGVSCYINDSDTQYLPKFNSYIEPPFDCQKKKRKLGWFQLYKKFLERPLKRIESIYFFKIPIK